MTEQAGGRRLSGEAPVIEVRDVSFSYGDSAVLDRASLSVRPREFVAIVGPNGGGKSTLLKLILGLLKPARGEVRLLGGEPVLARRRVGYMPQFAQLDPRFPVTVMDVVLMGRLHGGLQFGPYRAADRRVARQALRDVGLDDCRARPIHALSGGQRQRTLIARALACEPEILMLDEPTASLDMQVEEQLYALLQELNRRLTVLIVSHDVGFVSQFVQRVVCVNRTVQAHVTSAVTGEVIRQLYGHDVRMVHHGHEHPHAHQDHARRGPAHPHGRQEE